MTASTTHFSGILEAHMGGNLNESYLVLPFSETIGECGTMVSIGPGRQWSANGHFSVEESWNPYSLQRSEAWTIAIS